MPFLVLAVTFMSLLGVGTTVAQQTDEAYWNEPGPIVKDDAGHITYQEIRDPKNFTVRVFTNGVWLTQRYQPHTTHLTRVEAPDTTEEPVYEQGMITGIRVRVNGVTLNVHSERDAILGLPGSDQIRVEKDQTSRATAVRRGDGTDAARFTFDDEGYLRRAVIGALSLQLSAPAADGAVTETLTDAAGKAVATVTVPGDKLGKHLLGACLDPVRSLAGLGDDWPSTVRFKRSATATVTTATNTAGNRVLLYIVNYGRNRFGFDPAGKPLFIDAKLDLAGASLLQDGDKNAIAAQRQSAVAPTHVVVTADGHVGACVDGAGPGAIASFWTERGADGRELVRYRTIGKTAIGTKSGV